MFPPVESLEISPEELASLLQEGVPLRLVDCREEDEFSICKLEGAELSPLSQFGEGAARFSDEERPIVVYCHHGMRSQLAAHYLRQRGKDRTWSLTGGIDAWSRTIDPSVPQY